MSGIYISGMEMPTGCAECPFEMYYFNTGETRCRATNKTLETNYCPTSYEERDLDCPLIPVPDHGRLVDADAFERRCMFDSDIEDMQDVIYALRDYPTIIQAEHEEVVGE